MFPEFWGGDCIDIDVPCMAEYSQSLALDTVSSFKKLNINHSPLKKRRFSDKCIKLLKNLWLLQIDAQLWKREGLDFQFSF